MIDTCWNASSGMRDWYTFLPLYLSKKNEKKIFKFLHSFSSFLFFDYQHTLREVTQQSSLQSVFTLSVKSIESWTIKNERWRNVKCAKPSRLPLNHVEWVSAAAVEGKLKFMHEILAHIARMFTKLITNLITKMYFRFLLLMAFESKMWSGSSFKLTANFGVNR